MNRTLFLLVAVMGSMPGTAAAQGTKDPHWGVGVSFTPQWTAHESLKELFLEETGNLEGSEFTVGLVRGSTRGGEWGVSFVRKPLKDATFVSTDGDCPATPFCFTSTRSTELQSVVLQGAEFHWFVPFATIKDRVQIGLNVAGGAAFVEGTIVETMDNVFVFTNPQTGQVTTDRFHDTFARPATEVLYSIYPLIKLEAEAAVIVTPAFKVKVAGGLNFPGLSLRIGAIYLIGAK